MSYSNQQIAKQLAELIKQVKIQSSFSNGTISYGDQTFKLPPVNSLNRTTKITNR